MSINSTSTSKIKQFTGFSEGEYRIDVAWMGKLLHFYQLCAERLDSARLEKEHVQREDIVRSSAQALSGYVSFVLIGFLFTQLLFRKIVATLWARTVHVFLCLRRVYGTNYFTHYVPPFKTKSRCHRMSHKVEF